MADYGRIHLHLDSYPVSGTTTTLDSLAMGIPVLTSLPIITPVQSRQQFSNMQVSPTTFAPTLPNCLIMPAGLLIATTLLRRHCLVMYVNHLSVMINLCHVCLPNSFSKMLRQKLSKFFIMFFLKYNSFLPNLITFD